MSGYVEYSSNNSGGKWWLSDKNWRDLETAGWEVNWGGQERPFSSADEVGNNRWLGALATSATRRGLSIADAVKEWERVTGLSSTAAGCACCGQPHSFYEYDASGKYVTSGPEIYHEGRW